MDPSKEHDDEPDPWDEVTDRFTELAQRIGNTYRDSASSGPSEDEVRDALRTLGSAWQSMTSALASALGDPDIRRDVSKAATSMAAAVGESLGEFGRAINKDRRNAPADGPTEDQAHAADEEE